MADDILVLPDVEPGKKSQRIGDIHGGLTAFREVLAGLKKGDRAICIGDLTDRGEDSLGVIEEILQHRKDIANGADKGEFYSTFGNHEENIIEAIRALERNLIVLLNDDGTLNEVEFEQFLETDPSVSIAIHPHNGGQWLVDLFKEELRKGLISLDGEGEMKYHPGSKLLTVKEYIAELPYLVYADKTINGHADIPLSDEELLRKIRENDLTLTPEQKEYTIWSRKGDKRTPFKNVGRNANSILAFVGHNIVSQYGSNYTPSVRFETNTTNLDVASFMYGIIFAVDVNNPTDLARIGKLKADVIIFKDGEYYTADGDLIENKKYLANALKTRPVYNVDFYAAEETIINNHMADQRLKFAMFDEAKNCKSMDELIDLVKKYSAEFEKYYGEENVYTPFALMEAAIRNNALTEDFLTEAVMNAVNLEILLECGFDRNYKFKNDMTLVDYIKDDPALSRVYIQAQLCAAIKNNDMEAAQAAMKCGASIFCRNSSGQSPLDLAANDVVVLDLLFANSEVDHAKYEGDLNLKDRYLHTGWSNHHYFAIANTVDSYKEIIKGIRPSAEEASKQAAIPASCLNKMMYAVTTAEQASRVEAALTQFFLKHPADKDGFVKVSTRAIRRMIKHIERPELPPKNEASEIAGAKNIVTHGVFSRSSQSDSTKPKEKEKVTLSREARRDDHKPP